MKVIIAGSRTIEDYKTVVEAVDDSQFPVFEIVSGGANGVDKLGERLANELGIPCKMFPADWATHGNRAGYLRNIAMASYADALVAVWDGKSKGTEHMISEAKANNLLIHIKIV